MSEMLKTLVYSGVALVLMLAAILVSLPRREAQVESEVGQMLCPDFTKAEKAAKMSIARIDSQNKLQQIDVEEKKGRWVVASNSDYPADAVAQVAAAASVIINIPIIDMASDNPEDHSSYGVVEPTAKNISDGLTGFGTLVAFEDAKGKDLAKLIIGNEVKDIPGQRFVRRVGESKTYLAAIKTDKLTTNFGDWIEKDLLKIGPWDIDRLTIKDYQFVIQEGGPALDPRLELTTGWDADSNSWVLDGMNVFVKGRPVAALLKEDEQLNKEKLDDLKSALDNLQIADAQRKPTGMQADLSADMEILKDAALRQSLQQKGFAPVQMNRKIDLVGSNGEINVGTKDGVQYVLRFGNISGTDEGITKEGEVKMRRYLLVTARLDLSRLKPPTLEDLPAAPMPVDPPKPDPTAKEKDAPADPEKKPDPASDFNLKRQLVEKENERKTKEYEERKKKAEAKVKELNNRFADWYYIVSDDEFKKLHLTRGDLIQERTGAGAEGFGPDALRSLQSEGIEKPLPPPMPPGGGRQGLPPGLPPGLNFGGE